MLLFALLGPQIPLFIPPLSDGFSITRNTQEIQAAQIHSACSMPSIFSPFLAPSGPGRPQLGFSSAGTLVTGFLWLLKLDQKENSSSGKGGQGGPCGKCRLKEEEAMSPSWAAFKADSFCSLDLSVAHPAQPEGRGKISEFQQNQSV